MKKINDGLTATQRYAYNHAIAGLCAYCPNKRAEGSSRRCQDCLDKRRKDYNKRIKKDETVNE